jgi:hypothetical protein
MSLRGAAVVSLATARSVAAVEHDATTARNGAVARGRVTGGDEQWQQGIAELPERRLDARPAGDDEDVKAVRPRGQLDAPHDLPDAATDAVPLDSPAQAPGRGDAEAVDAFLVRHRAHDHQAVGAAASARLEAGEVAASGEDMRAAPAPASGVRR